MVIDIHYNGIDATVGITTEVTGQFAPAFETRFPTDASPNGYGYQQFYVNNDNQNLYTQVMKSTCVPLAFRDKEELVKWANTFFKGKIKTEPMMEQYLEKNRHALALKSVAEGMFSNYALLSHYNLCKRSGSPVFEVQNLDTAPIVRLAEYDEKKTPFQFRYDEAPLIPTYLRAVYGKPTTCVRSNPKKVVLFNEADLEVSLKEFRIKPMNDFYDGMPNRDIRVMDWLEKSVMKCLTPELRAALPEDEKFAIMRNLIEENGGLDFCAPLDIDVVRCAARHRLS